jgi:hypothetical protein
MAACSGRRDAGSDLDRARLGRPSRSWFAARRAGRPECVLVRGHSGRLALCAADLVVVPGAAGVRLSLKQRPGVGSGRLPDGLCRYC